MIKLISVGALAIALTACGPLAPYSEDEETPAANVTTPTTSQIEATSETPEVTPKPEPEPEPQPEPELRRAEIDWNAARADFAAVQAENPEAMVGIASTSDAPPVPVILPQLAGIASGDDGLQFRPLGDGYFANVRGETYDMLINGTDRLGPTPPGADKLDEDAFRFEETMTGAQVSFKRYGASYLVEFACKDPAAAITGSCISEEEALAAVKDMLIAGTQ